MVQNPLLNNRYRLIKEEGIGGMAIVYKAQDLELDRIVAVKVLKAELVADPEFLMRFREEARAAAKLSHPNIVSVYDFGQDGPTHFMVLEHVEGRDLQALMAEQGVLDIESTLAITIELCKGLGYAHRAGLVHGDVKPHNILVTSDSQIKLTDFGLARALTVSRPHEAQGLVWGTPSYLAPECSAGEPPSTASDVYSLGIVLFELLTGRVPFEGADYRELAMAHMQVVPPLASQLNPLVPTALDDIVRKVLSKEPSLRYRTADQLGRILIGYRQQGQHETGNFPVRASQPGVTQAAPDNDDLYEAEPDPQMPPLEVERHTGRDTMRHAAVGEAPREEYMVDNIDDSLPVKMDLYTILLGLLAVGAVVGLIPLWISVLSTFGR